MQEATMCGCVPIVPDALAYKELYPQFYRNTSFADSVFLVKYIIKEYESDAIYGRLKDLRATRNKIIRRGKDAIPNILTVLKGIR
jgi:hypothetical protein